VLHKTSEANNQTDPIRIGFTDNFIFHRDASGSNKSGMICTRVWEEALLCASYADFDSKAQFSLLPPVFRALARDALYAFKPNLFDGDNMKNLFPSHADPKEAKKAAKVIWSNTGILPLITPDVIHYVFDSSVDKRILLLYSLLCS
jgi:hypothetical protein